MAKVGRPPKVKEADMPELVEKFRRYIEETDIPIIAEFAYMNGFGKNYFHEREEFSNLIKIAIAKKEAALEIGSLKGTLNPTMAIFSLKQIGWKDKPDNDHELKTLVKLLSSGAGFTPEQIELIMKAGKNDE